MCRHNVGLPSHHATTVMMQIMKLSQANVNLTNDQGVVSTKSVRKKVGSSPPHQVCFVLKRTPILYFNEMPPCCFVTVDIRYYDICGMIEKCQCIQTI